MKRINMYPWASANGGVGLGMLTSSGNPWSVPDTLAYDLVNRSLAELVDAESGSTSPVSVDRGTGAILQRGWIYNAGTTYESAMAAIADAKSAGGGTIFWPAAKVNLKGKSLPFVSGVYHVAQKPSLQFDNITDDGTVTFIDNTGTVLSNSPAAFTANAVDLGAKMADKAFANACVNNAGLEGFGFDSTCTYGVRIGGRYNGGPIYCRFKSLIAIGCAAWGFWFENFIQTEFDDINAFACGQGHQMYRVSEGGCGNSRWGKLLGSAANGGALSRGICCTSEAGQDFGLLNAQYVQFNRFNNTPEWSATTAGVNGSANLNVGAGNAAKFPVDLPVTPTASVNGFLAGVIYFVVSNVGGVIQLSDRVKGNPIASTGTAAITLKSTGFACFECVVEGPLSAGGSMGKGTIGGLDMETGGSTLGLLQNWGGVLDVTVAVDTVSYAGLVMRGCGPSVVCSTVPLVLDLDSASATYVHLYGSLKAATQYYPQGVVRNANGGANSSSLGLFDGAKKPAIEGRYKSGLQMKMWNAMVFNDPLLVNNGWIIGWNDSVNALQYNDGAAGGSFTIPTIDDDHLGYPLWLINPTANPVTVNVAGGQRVNNKPGVTSFVMPAYWAGVAKSTKFAGVYSWFVQTGTITI